MQRILYEEALPDHYQPIGLENHVDDHFCNDPKAPHQLLPILSKEQDGCDAKQQESDYAYYYLAYDTAPGIHTFF